MDGSRSTGWWYTYPSEKYEFVSWDDYTIPNWMGKESSHVPVTTITNISSQYYPLWNTIKHYYIPLMAIIIPLKPVKLFEGCNKPPSPAMSGRGCYEDSDGKWPSRNSWSFTRKRFVIFHSFINIYERVSPYYWWLPSGNQTWRAGKSSVNGGLDRKIT